VPPLLASAAIVGLLALALYVLVIGMPAPLSSWIGRAPELQAIFKDRLSALQRPLSALAIAFWAWLWGPLGALLAVPLLLVVVIVGRHLFPAAEFELPG